MTSPRHRIVVVGGGAAGIFAAIASAEAASGSHVTVLERSPHFLSKVRISGGGRCNVTHACFEPRALAQFYPRGGSALLGAFHAFQPRDTIAWFQTRGVKLKTEPDNRIFPATDSSQTIIDCLMRAAETAQVELLPNRSPVRARRHPNGCFELEFADRACLTCDTLLLATGGCRAPAAAQLAMSLGHSLSAPVPSLFTFHVAAPWLTRLAGVSLPSAEVCLPEFRRRETGPVLITHSGLSGPAILRLSAWCARPLHEAQYRATLRVNWLPHLTADELVRRLGALRSAQPARLVANSALTPLPSRLWESLVLASGLPRGTRWAEVSRSSRHALVQQLQQTGLEVIGKTLNQDEFVTCGGVPLNEVDMKTMESRICPGLHFAGELLDIDGLTGGFNFQAAWTTGWLAGQAMAARAVQVTSF